MYGAPEIAIASDTGQIARNGGVTFYRNGSLNRTDATGPNANSVWQMWPRFNSKDGDVIRAERFQNISHHSGTYAKLCLRIP